MTGVFTILAWLFGGRSEQEATSERNRKIFEQQLAAFRANELRRCTKVEDVFASALYDKRAERYRNL